MAGEEDAYVIVQEKTAKITPFLNSKETVVRKGYFLKPSSSESSSLFFCSSFVSPDEAAGKPDILFKGWTTLANWEQWVKKLKPIYKELWKKVGILDAINVSVYKFHRHPASFFGVCRFWCGETNTFLFPWGEATVTLEDVMILGGFSVLGECVLTIKTLEGDLGELEEKILLQAKIFNKTKAKKACSSIWLKHYLEEGNCDELEHVAFLTLWLSDFVLTSHPFKIIKKRAIPIAIQLARGVRVALAPAVLASIYRDMRKIKSHLFNNENREPLDVWAPFHILQLWVWERFKSSQPESLYFVNLHEPRGARWHGSSTKLENDHALSIFWSQDELEWRPYSASLDHWCKPSYYECDYGRWIDEVVDEGIASYIQCLRACELVGIDCIEQYLPYRVARQFGYDQEIPYTFPRAKSKWEIAWKTYEFDANKIKLYIPPRQYRSDITLEYSKWWDNVPKFASKIKLKNLREILNSCVKGKMEEDMDDITLPLPLRKKKKKLCSSNDAASTSHIACKNTKMNNDAYDMNRCSVISEKIKLKVEHQTNIENSEKCMEFEPSSKAEERIVVYNPIVREINEGLGHTEEAIVSCIQNSHVCESKQYLGSQDSSKYQVENVSKQYLDSQDSAKYQVESENQNEEDACLDSIETMEKNGNVLDIKNDIEKISLGETIYEPEVVNDESADEKIRKLKEEIAIIHAKVQELETKEAGT